MWTFSHRMIMLQVLIVIRFYGWPYKFKVYATIIELGCKMIRLKNWNDCQNCWLECISYHNGILVASSNTAAQLRKLFSNGCPVRKMPRFLLRSCAVM